MFKFKVNRRSLETIEEEQLVSGTINDYEVEFEFDECWDGWTPHAVFTNTWSHTTKEQLLEDSKCIIPWEVLTPGTLMIGIYGIKDDKVRPTIYAEKLCISEGVDHGDFSKEPTPDIYNQLLTTIWKSVIEGANIDEDYNLIIRTKSGEIYNAGQIPQGEDGATPIIGENGNWWVDNVDTGIRALAIDGKDFNYEDMTDEQKLDLVSRIPWDSLKEEEVESIKEKLGIDKEIDSKVASLIDSAPEALNTLKELASALGNDPNFATTVLQQLGNKVDKLEKPKDSNVVYVETKNGSTTGIKYATTPKSYAIPQRLNLGELLVRENPDLDNEAVSKKYVDDSIVGKLNNLPIKDLGVFDLNLNNGDMGFDEDVYQSYLDTIDNLDSGIYTLKFIEAKFNRTEFYFVTKGKSLHGDYSSQIRFIDNSVFQDNTDHMEIERREYFDNHWTKWISLNYLLNNKVDKEEGKGLSTNDFTDEYKMLVEENSYRIGDLDDLYTDNTDNLVDAVNEIYSGKVNKEEGKGLSSNDFTDTQAEQLDELYSKDAAEYWLRSDRLAYDIYAEDPWEEYQMPTISQTKELINPKPLDTYYMTLKVNRQYNFGELKERFELYFPTNANDGDVIYVTFKTGNNPLTLAIDTTNTCDIELIPETDTGYEIFGKYNGEIWILNYSEYTVSEG